MLLYSRYRRKGGLTLKNKKITMAILLIIIAIIALFLGLTIRKFIILKEISKKASQYDNITNYYEKVLDSSGMDIEYFCKENKSKKIITDYKEGTRKLTMYNNGKEVNTYVIEPNGIKVASLGSNISFSEPNILGFRFDGNFWHWVKLVINSNISITELNGKECYYINGGLLTNTYIEKETGLILKMQNGIRSDGSEPIILEYYYEFGNVTDDDFIEPNILEYTIQ